jgi:dTDP-4-dehydrorhamnose 3,5-epimerase
MLSDKPTIIQGGIGVDDRGSVRYANDFNFEGVKRFYQVENHRRGFIRAWHGHHKEGKYVYVAKGSALVGAVQINIDSDVQPQKFILSDKQPKILWVPAGYANGFMTLEEDTIVMFFTTSTIEETKNDDIRYPYDTWNIWTEDFR